MCNRAIAERGWRIVRCDRVILRIGLHGWGSRIQDVRPEGFRVEAVFQGYRALGLEPRAKA